jgi:hypothetical protein
VNLLSFSFTQGGKNLPLFFFARKASHLDLGGRSSAYDKLEPDLAKLSFLVRYLQLQKDLEAFIHRTTRLPGLPAADPHVWKEEISTQK